MQALKDLIFRLRATLEARFGDTYFSVRRRLNLPAPFLVIAAGVFVFVLLVSTRPETKPSTNDERVWSVVARSVAYGPVTPTIKAFGELRAKKQVRLRALVSGEVVSTSEKFEDGARVSRGDVLVQIDKFVYETRLAEARAALKGAKALLVERAASAELAEQDYKRADQLFTKGTVSKKMLDDRKTDFTIKSARKDQQQSNVDRHKVQVKRARRDLRNTSVVAPFDGYVTQISAREGRVLNPNDQVAMLLDSDNFEVVFNLSDDEYGRFLQRNTDVIGRPVQLVWNVGDEQTTLGATIERVGAQISQATRGVDIYATLEGKIPSNLRGGAFVEVELTAQPVDGVMALPKDALYSDNRVYLVKDGRLEPRTLVDFVDDGAQVLLKSGLADGEVVLLTRFNEAAPGVAVKVVDQP
jgi:RND family efflux transporter MFP subunit